MTHAAQHIPLLTERDIAIIAMTFSYGGCGIRHVRTRLFPSAGARSSCYARLSELMDAGFLNGQRLPAAGGQGSGPIFLTPGIRSRPLLAKLLHLPRSEMRRQSRARSPFILGHNLAVADFRVALELAVEQSAGYDSIDWTPEWSLRRNPLKVRDPLDQLEIPLIADGAFTLTLPNGAAQRFLLELDMATVPAKRLSTKLRGYLALSIHQLLPVLFVTSHADRAAAIARLASNEAKRLSSDPTIIWIALQCSVAADSVLAKPIWQVAGGPSAIALQQVVPAGGTR